MKGMNVNEPFLLTFDESWFKDYSDIHRFRVTADLGECEEEIENEQGVIEKTKVHKYKVKQID